MDISNLNAGSKMKRVEIFKMRCHTPYSYILLILLKQITPSPPKVLFGSENNFLNFFGVVNGGVQLKNCAQF